MNCLIYLKIFKSADGKSAQQLRHQRSSQLSVGAWNIGQRQSGSCGHQHRSSHRGLLVIDFIISVFILIGRFDSSADDARGRCGVQSHETQ